MPAGSPIVTPTVGRLVIVATEGFQTVNHCRRGAEPAGFRDERQSVSGAARNPAPRETGLDRLAREHEFGGVERVEHRHRHIAAGDEQPVRRPDGSMGAHSERACDPVTDRGFGEIVLVADRERPLDRRSVGSGGDDRRLAVREPLYGAFAHSKTRSFGIGEQRLGVEREQLVVGERGQLLEGRLADAADDPECAAVGWWVSH